MVLVPRGPGNPGRSKLPLALRVKRQACPAFPVTARKVGPTHLSQFAVLVLHDDLVLLQLLQLGLGGHLLELQLLPGTFLLLQLLLEFLKGEDTRGGRVTLTLGWHSLREPGRTLGHKTDTVSHCPQGHLLEDGGAGTKERRSMASIPNWVALIEI